MGRCCEQKKRLAAAATAGCCGGDVEIRKVGDCPKNNTTSSTADKANVEQLKPPHDWMTFYPLGLTLMYILIGSLTAQYPFTSFNLSRFCSIFMGIWLITFSYLKLLNPRSFVHAFQKYDLFSMMVCSWWPWVFPFFEFTLGLFFILPSMNYLANILTLNVSALQMIQVYIALYQGKKLECACMGSLGFKLPLSTITFLENFTMMIMAMYMLYSNHTSDVLVI